MCTDIGVVFSVPHEVANIFIAEEKIVNVIPRSASYEDVEIFMESWTSRYNELKLSQLSEQVYYDDVLVKLVGNPVHVFNLMDRSIINVIHMSLCQLCLQSDRLVILLPKIMEGMTDSDQNEIKNVLDSLTMKADESDVEGAMQALVRVQFAYKSVEDREDDLVTENISDWTLWT